MAGFRNNFHDHRRLLEQLLESQVSVGKLEQAPWRGLLEEFFTISKWLQRGKQKLFYKFSSQNLSQKLWKHSSFLQKYCFDFKDPQKSKQILHFVTLSLENKLIIVFLMGVARFPPPISPLSTSMTFVLVSSSYFSMFLHIGRGGGKGVYIPPYPASTSRLRDPYDVGRGNKEPFSVPAKRSVFL